MGQQVTFSLAAARAAGIMVKVEADIHETGGGPEQNDPWLDLFGVIEDTHGRVWSVNITGTDNPTCWMDRSYVLENRWILGELLDRGVYFTFS